MCQIDAKEKLRYQLEINREQAIKLGEEAVRIIRDGYYLLPGNRRIDVQDYLDRSVKETQISYFLPLSHKNYSCDNKTIIKVKNQTTLAAVQELLKIVDKPVALNFSSPSEPGGGFLRGSRAQEEYLARSTGIWACLNQNPIFYFSHPEITFFYNSHFIYSPDVVVFRDDDGFLLEKPYSTSIISAPAVQATVIRHHHPTLSNQINEEMWKRILSVLYVAKNHDHSSIVLGAWGCGAFGNDPYDIARLFKKALEENFFGAFVHVVFAIADWSNDDRFIGPFREVFEGD